MSARRGRWGENPGSGANAERQPFGPFLERNRLFLHLGAAGLALVAAATHAVDQVPVVIAPLCAAIAALLVVLVASLNSSSSVVTTAALPEEAIPNPSLPLASDQSAQVVPVSQYNLRSAQANANLAAELAQAAALAQLTARISHDLRTPLNAVIGFSELMSKETFGPLGSQRYQDYAKHIRDCGETLLKSTEDTLAITSALAQPMGEASAAWGRPIPLAGLVDEAWGCVAVIAARESMSLSCDLPEALELFGDRRVIRQILVNLFQDAISRGRWHARIKVGAVLDGQGIRLTIETQGRAQHEEEETLPLCVARALAELHGLPVAARFEERDVWTVSVKLERVLQPDFFFDSRAYGRAPAAA